MFKGADLMQSNQGVSDTPSMFYFNPYVFTDKTTLQTAIDAWIEDLDAAKETYGEINGWNVSEISDFSSLFEDKSTFNSDISNWDVSNGTNFSRMFYSASDFNLSLIHISEPTRPY